MRDRIEEGLLLVGSALFGALLGFALFGCNGIDPCDVEQTLCYANGGTWVVEAPCGRCEYPEPPACPDTPPEDILLPGETSIPECSDEATCDCAYCDESTGFEWHRAEPCPPPPDPCDGLTCDCGCADGACLECPPLPPGDTSCSSIPAPDVPANAYPNVVPTRQDAVKAAIQVVKAECGGSCGLPWTRTLERLAQVLNGQGLCATGPWVDALAVLREDGGVEEYHPVFSGNGSWTANESGKYIGTWYYDFEDCPLAALPAFARFNQQCPKPHGQYYDCTALFGPDAARCASIGYTDGRQNCVILPDGHPHRDVCEEMAMGGPVLVRCSVGEVVHKNDNRWLSACADPASEFIEYCLPDGTECRRRTF